ncbi:MAG: hypothetical protein L6R42_005986 [Xanthoria sp. 1 TBL-2021]|nr:MAG: hypothetical protein L6R42_005986 [Xanthoria sp. 1 TBL-2021]
MAAWDLPSREMLYQSSKSREIQSFAENLQQLEAVVDNANRQRPPRRYGNSEHECRIALQPVSQAVGDFKKTLDECEKLLNDHERFRRDTAGFVDNVVWHVSTQRDCDILRERVQFHATKLLIVSKPFEIQLLLEIRQELRDLRRDVSEIKGLLVNLLRNEEPALDILIYAQRVTFPGIPEEVVKRFSDSLTSYPPATFRDVANMPLKEGFDALVYNFAKSTVEFNPGFDPSQRTPEETQFVNLLKSRWILDRMEQSSHLSAAGTAPLWTSALAEIKSDIIKEYRRFDTNQLVAPPKDVIVRLPDECFSIWVVDAPPLVPPDLAEQRPLEDQILELALPDSVGTRRSSLHVFRRSPIELRLVTTTRDTANPGYHQEKGKPHFTHTALLVYVIDRSNVRIDFIVNTDITRVIPAYGTPGGNNDSHNLLLSNRQVQDLRWQYLCTAEDVQSLQQALTGYRVHHSTNNFLWAINGSDKPHKTGKAMLQMWQPQSLPVPAEPSDTLPLSPIQSSASVTSPRSSSFAGSNTPSRRSTALSTSTTLFSGSSATSVMVGNRGNGTAVKTPEPPVIVFFTMYDGKYAFLHFKRRFPLSMFPKSSRNLLIPNAVTDRIYVDPERCYCRQNSRKPCRTVVIVTKDKSIDLRRFHASQESGKGLYTWDLARFRIPRHPQYKDVEVVKKVEYLTLEFDTVEAKNEFRKELRSLEKVRNLDNDMCRNIIAEKQIKDHKPSKK